MSGPPSHSSESLSQSPLIICGCPGTGTSLVTKMLRHAGLFTGIDSGDADARKYHESQSFQQYNIDFLTETIQFPHAPKSVAQFEMHNGKMQQQIDGFSDRIDRNRLFADYFGVNGRNPEQPWGWKDPRNSATAMVWHRMFPHSRVIVVQRRWRWRDRWKRGGSQSGRWYRSQSTSRLRELYENPVGLENCSLRRVDVDRFTSDANYFAATLAWCALDCAPARRFDDFLRQVHFERPSRKIWRSWGSPR